MYVNKPRPTTSCALTTACHPQLRQEGGWPLGLIRVGKEYGYYEQDLIGQGLSSKVYRGQHTVTKKLVSIKVIKKQQMRQNNIAALLYNEVKVLKKLNHENVLALEHFEENDRQLCVITEYCNGGDLEQLIAKKKKLPEYLALSILEDIIKGYGHLAANNILHRDIKPANIFMSNGRAKLADFGFAMTMKYQYSLFSDVFSKEQAVGSPLYMPPQTLEHLEYSHKADIFGIGVVFYEMLHGYMPWEAVTQKQLLYRMKKKPCTISEELSDKSKAFLEAALERKVDARMDEKELVSFFRKQRSKMLAYQKQQRQAINDSLITPRPDKPLEKHSESNTNTPRKEPVVKPAVETASKFTRRRVDSYCQVDKKVDIKRNFVIQQMLQPPKTSKYRPVVTGWLK